MHEHYVILTLSGEYDVAYRNALRGELEAVKESESLVVDLSGVTFFDSACLGDLLALHRARVAAGRPRLTVVQNEVFVKRLFELLDLNQVFHTVDSINEVLPSDQTAVIRQYASGGNSRTSASVK